ncbi:hypothetical protein [Vibrio hepatarius]|uniref:hypothetical protein n=1 Tax=Vibrio hepatarius TaxID=171383 RepID=UPI001C086B24|nr:hypothetical protein [Vibrio hepatarius]MBU2898019.1 hypothetical protein [Vibrio hepatarius]
MNDDMWIHAGSSKTTDAKDKEPVVMHAPAGNMFWADDQSGQNLDIQFAVNGKKSPSLPKEFTPRATLIRNTVDETCNSLELYLNGQSHTLVERVPTEAITAPGDLRAAFMTCPVKSKPYKPMLTVDENSDNEYLNIYKADDSLDLPESKLGETYHIDDMPEPVIAAIYETLSNNSLIQNTVATALNEGTNQYQIFDYYKEKYGYEAAKGYLKELIAEGRFTVIRVKQWGGKLGIAFKGNARTRRFLTSINYGITHDKVSVLKTYVEISAGNGLKNTTSQIFKEAIPWKGGNIIGFVFATSFDVYDFFKKDIGEQNIAEFAGALGVTTLKVAAASFGALGATALLIAAFTTFHLTLPSLLVLSFGLLATIVIGYAMDYLDTKYYLKDSTKAFLKEAFPDLTTENILNHFLSDSVAKGIREQEDKINQYIGEHAMQGSGIMGF